MQNNEEAQASSFIGKPVMGILLEACLVYMLRINSVQGFTSSNENTHGEAFHF